MQPAQTAGFIKFLRKKASQRLAFFWCLMLSLFGSAHHVDNR
jgi:hypothetical protein